MVKLVGFTCHPPLITQLISQNYSAINAVENLQNLTKSANVDAKIGDILIIKNLPFGTSLWESNEQSEIKVVCRIKNNAICLVVDVEIKNKKLWAKVLTNREIGWFVPENHFCKIIE